MKNTLYFICPTDGLETVINAAFPSQNYFYTSLGNSIVFDQEMLRQTKRLIHKREISNITFVLSAGNRIVLDALNGRDYLDVMGLDYFYFQINQQQEKTKLSWQTPTSSFLLFSYYLNDKIKELQAGLPEISLKISGKIYDQHQGIFKEIYPDLVCMDYVNFN